MTVIFDALIKSSPWVSDLIRTGLDPISSPCPYVPEQKLPKQIERPVAPPSTLTRLKSRRSEEEQDPTCAAATLRVLKEKVTTATSTR